MFAGNPRGVRRMARSADLYGPCRRSDVEKSVGYWRQKL